MAILTDGVGCGSPGGKWPCYPAVFCVPTLSSVFLCCVLYSYVAFCFPMLCSVFLYCVLYSVLLCCALCTQISSLCGTVGAIVSNHGVWMCVDVCGWGVDGVCRTENLPRERWR